MKYIDVCKALYDYEAGSEDELTFKEDDILYILERDDDDWWKAQLKPQQPDEVGPIGLIPANYASEAEAIGAVSAQFDYDAQQEEEVSFKENDTMILYDKDDPDWYLVKLENGDIGLAPSNYVEETSSDQVTEAHPQTASDETEAQPTVSVFSALSNATDKPKPKKVNDEAKSWPVHEYDVDKKKKKKSKGNLLVGNGMLCYGSETDKASPVRQFPVLDIANFTQDSKTVHIEIGGSKAATLDFQASSKSEAKAIITKIQSSRQASTAFESASATTPPAIVKAQPVLPPVQPIREASYQDEYEPEVEEPQEEEVVDDEPPCEPRWAIVLYAFEAQGEDEISVNQEDQVLITDYVTSDEWWKIEYEDGRSGVIPASYAQFQEDYEAALQAEEDQRQREEEEWARQQAEEEAARAAEEDRRRREEEEAWQRQQMEEEEKERRRQEQEESRRREAERRKKVQEDARQRELDEKKRAARAAVPPPPPLPASAPSSQPPRRNQIPAPPPPPERPAAHRSLPSDQAVNSISVPSNRSLPDRPKQAQNPGKPDPAKTRTWTDRTGGFKVEAQFLAVHDGKIRLHKINGVKIDVPIEKMCVEDVRYIEQEVGAEAQEDKSDNMPLAHLAKEASNSQRPKSQAGSSKQGWDWFDYFMRANIPMQESLRYSSSFQADNLGEADLHNLTHRRMKTLGLSERHVQRLQRFIESETPEPASDDEANQVKRSKGKRNVSFGATSVIGEGSDGQDTKLSQIEEDERLARELQEQEDNNGSSPSIFKKDTGLQRRGTSRPTPSNSAPKGINADVFELMKGQLSSEPLKPTAAASSPKPTVAKSTPVAEASKSPAKPSGGFEDDAWAPRQASPVVAKKPEAASSPAQPNWTNTWTPTQQPQQQQPPKPAQDAFSNLANIQPNVQAPPAPPPPPPVLPSVQQQSMITSPARQRPIPKQSQDSKVNSQVFNQWSSPSKNTVSQQPTGMSNQAAGTPANFQGTPTNFQGTPVNMQMNNSAIPNQAMMNNMQQQQRPFLAPQATGFVQQQPTQQFTPTQPQMTGMQQQPNQQFTPTQPQMTGMQQQPTQQFTPTQPQMTGMQRPPQPMMVNSMMTGQSLQQPLMNNNTGMSNMMQPQQPNMQQFQSLQPQATGFNTFNNNIGRSSSAGNLPSMGISAQPTGQRNWTNATPDNPFGASPQVPQMTGQPFNQTSPVQPNMYTPLAPQQQQQPTGFMQPQPTGFNNGMLGANGQAMDRSFSGPSFGS
ncbi:hypothetical protein INT44_004344, partial [Umbelopsis vinacea]